MLRVMVAVQQSGSTNYETSIVTNSILLRSLSSNVFLLFLSIYVRRQERFRFLHWSIAPQILQYFLGNQVFALLPAHYVSNMDISKLTPTDWQSWTMKHPQNCIFHFLTMNKIYFSGGHTHIWGAIISASPIEMSSNVGKYATFITAILLA